MILPSSKSFEFENDVHLWNGICNQKCKNTLIGFCFGFDVLQLLLLILMLGMVMLLLLLLSSELLVSDMIVERAIPLFFWPL